MAVEIVLPLDGRERLTSALEAAGKREIGGVLMGECLEPGKFRVVDLTVQSRGGSLASFMRRLGEALSALARFFRSTRGEYARFNYLGEWHSHPLFSTEPSDRDTSSMQQIATDPEVGANFVVLLIARLGTGSDLEASAYVYWPDGGQERAKLSMEAASG